MRAPHQPIFILGPTGCGKSAVAVQLAQRPEFVGKTIVALLPDSGERYLSTGIFD